MNSEELEQSLRSEFESYLKQISADMQQEATEFQGKIEAEVKRHQAQLMEDFQDFSARVQTAYQLDAGFKDSVVEHLRLARDEGARITATAIGEAEEFEKEVAANAAPVAGVSELRDGISDISNQNSQATILKALVEHAGQFTPRGAFFIIKNEHFVGWRVFGNENTSDDQAVREVFFPISADSTLGESIKSLSAVESRFGVHADDSIYLDELEFGEPDKMVAIPLVARGRGVAVLYADRGTNGEEVNVQALETLVRVTGMTVEILAASGGKSAAARPVQKPAEAEKQEEFTEQKDFNAGTDFQTPQTQPSGFSTGYVPSPVETPAETDYQPSVEEQTDSSQTDSQTETALPSADFKDYAIEEYSVEEVETVEETAAKVDDFQPVYEDSQTEAESYSWNQPAEATGELTEQFEEPTELQEETETFQPVITEDDFSAPANNEYQFETAQSFEPAQNQFQETPNSFDASEFETASFETTSDYSPAKADNFSSFDLDDNVPVSTGFTPAITAPEPVAETVATTAKPVRSRLSDKNVDLPIEVTEDQRRLHNDARRFARLLVSEIKLYNEQKVKEGRDSNDLYDRLREAIDRSREMYDKRIQPPVAAKFDYFHYEVVTTLAEGDEAKLGDSYPGATV